MKTEEKNNRPYLYLLLAIIFVPLLGLGFLKMNNWYSSHYFDFNAPVTVALHPLWEVKDKEATAQANIPVVPKDETANEKIIRLVNEKFGTEAPRTLVLLQGES